MSDIEMPVESLPNPLADLLSQVSISKIRLQPGEKLLVRVSPPPSGAKLTQEQFDFLAAAFRLAWGKDIPLLIVESSVEVSVLSVGE